MNGTIKKLVKDKVFGFILGADGVEYFFHQSSCTHSFDALGERDHVSFQIVPSAKGPRAEEVTPAKH